MGKKVPSLTIIMLAEDLHRWPLSKQRCSIPYEALWGCYYCCFCVCLLPRVLLGIGRLFCVIEMIVEFLLLILFIWHSKLIDFSHLFYAASYMLLDLVICSYCTEGVLVVISNRPAGLCVYLFIYFWLYFSLVLASG